jgi:hypothetical protein
MFDPGVVRARQTHLEHRFRSAFPHGLARTSIADAHAITKTLAALWDPDAQAPTRGLTREETTWIETQRLLSLVDFRYWAERFCFVNKGGERLEPLAPLWTSQELVLRQLAAIEREQQAGYQDGCLVAVLKARQLGVSTLSQAILVHRCTTRPHTSTLTAADETDQTGYLFEMAERMLLHLPWFLKPGETAHRGSGERRLIAWETGAVMRSESGKSMRGQSVEDSGESRGQMGRGKTFSAVHLSELSTWDNPEQLDGSLFPGIPIAAGVVGLLESTAKGRHNWWHKQWTRSTTGGDRFRPVFIPWYAEPDKWRLRPPDGWQPTPATLTHAAQCEADAVQWLGAPVRLTADQLYWYERERTKHEREGTLATFLSEYPATPEESFQFSGRSIFSLETRERIAAQKRPVQAVWLIEPAAVAQANAELRRPEA